MHGERCSRELGSGCDFEPRTMVIRELSSVARAWPADGVEHLGRCPICRAAERALLHDQLTDRVMFVAPGEWTMWRCGGCGSGYLDPRPTEATIGLAYERYHTHTDPATPAPSGIADYLRRAVGNDYRHARFGARSRPRLPLLGGLIARCFPAVTSQIDHSYRCLPRCSGGSVLDVGCGNGGFLKLAQNAGWSTAGCDIDPEARELAKAYGTIEPTLAQWENRRGSFDYITISHVLEHVHDPRATIAAMTKLLTSGGSLYIETPNVDAPTHQRFGAAWRGLEAPRHLTLFAKGALADLLSDCGLRIVRWVEFPGATEFLVKQSRDIAAGRDPYSGETVAPPIDPAPAASVGDGESEFLAVIARKDA